MTMGFAEREFDETALSQKTAGALGLSVEIGDTFAPSAWQMKLIRASGPWTSPASMGLIPTGSQKSARSRDSKSPYRGRAPMNSSAGTPPGTGSSAWKELAGGHATCRGRCRACLTVNHCRIDGASYRILSETSDPFLASQMAVRTLFLESDVRRLLAAPLGECRKPAEAREYLSLCASQMGRRNGWERLSFMDICAHLQPRLLRDLDAMSMANSLEVRPVFLDDRVVDFLHERPKLFARPAEGAALSGHPAVHAGRSASGPEVTRQADIYVSICAVASA